MEEEQKAPEPEQEEEKSEEQPEEEPKEEEEPAEEKSEEEPAEPPEQEEKQPMSRRKALRIQKLIDKLQGGEEEPQKAPAAPKPGLDYRTSLQADEETYNQLEADRREYGEKLYQEGLKRVEAAQFHTRLEIDAPRIETKYPVFDKSSTEFNPAVANAINQWYLATAGYDAKTGVIQNANVRYSDFVEGIMELADEMASEKTSKTTQNIAKQAAVTGLRPDGSTSKRLNLNKAPEQMSDEELDTVLAQAFPKK